MQTILFNRTSNFITGIDREKLPYEYSVLTPFPITLSKSIQESTGQQIQKTNSENQPLFKDNIQIDSETGIETFDEVTNPTKVISTQTVTNEYRIATDQYTSETIINELGKEEEIQIPIYTTISTSSEIPLETVELEPVLVEEFVNKTYTLENGYMEFDYEEILEAKKQSINNNNLLKIVAFDEDFLESNLNLSQISVGDGILVLHGNNAELTTSPIQLQKSTNMFQIYLESQPNITISISGDNGLTFTDFDSKGKAKLPTPTDNVIIKFTNTSKNNREIYCYALLALA